MRGDFEKAIQFYEESFSRAKCLGDLKAQVFSLSKLGLLFWNIGKMDESLGYYKDALKLSEVTIPGTQQVLRDEIDIFTFYREGKHYRDLSQFADSINSFMRAVSLAQKINSKDHLVKCFRQVAVTYWEMNDLDRFFETTLQALELAQEIHHRIEIGRCSFNIGLYYSDISEYSFALKYYENAMSIFREMKKISDESSCLVNISDIYIQLGDYEKALLYLMDVLRIDRQLEDDLYIAMDLNNIGVTYRKKGLQRKNNEDLMKAILTFEEGLAFARRIQDNKIEVQCLNNMGTVYTDLNKYSDALRHLNLGLEGAENLGDEEEISTILLNLGTVYSKQQRYKQALDVLDQAIEMAVQIKDQTILWEAHARAGRVFKDMGQFDQAMEHLKKSIDIIESIRSNIFLEELKASFFGTDERLDSYYSLVDLYYRMDRNKGGHHFKQLAFETMEKAKARAFLDRLELSRVEVSGGVDPDLLGKENILMEKISRLNSRLIMPGLKQAEKENLLSELKRIEQDLETLNRKIRLNNPSYANLKYPHPVTLEEAQVSLPDSSTAYFSYCIGKGCSYAFVVTRKKIKIFPLPPIDDLREDIKNYLQIITDKDRFDFHPGYDLFNRLVSPGLENGIKKIIFVPDDVLHYLPFETLLTDKDNQRWLVQDYRISYVPSITSFREIIERKQGKKPKKDILSFGNPYLGQYEGQGSRVALLTRGEANDEFRLNPISFTQLEVDRISSLFKENKRDAYTGVEASETFIKQLSLSDYKIVHFATHALVNDRYPVRSSIVLSLTDDSTEDGLLQMREVFDLKFNADLVTLSACQTGLGKYIKGEGIEGINRAFFYAGASSVLMSLWAVNDQASYQFMQRFYTHLCSSDSLVEALRKSKIEMIDSEALSHPFYWAGFINSGDADRILFPSRRGKNIFLFVLLVLFASAFLVIAVKSISINP